jgi:tRNA A-37 threonylcarbamoyl transferase component Bud32
MNGDALASAVDLGRQIGAGGFGLVLVLVDLAALPRVEMVVDFLTQLRSSCEWNAPFVILLPHSAAAPLSVEVQFDVISHLVSAGVDDAVVGEPDGLHLACAVQTRVLRHNQYASTQKGAIDQQCHRATLLRNCIQKTMWAYLRVRLDTGIPDIDDDIMPGELTRIANYQRGAFLGAGAFGKVFIVEDLHDADNAHAEASTPHVIKSVPKSAISTMIGLKTLKNEIQVMRLLSSDTWQHPNIIKLYRVHHSETNIFLRMQCGGSQNLHQRLCSRDWPGPQPSVLMSSQKASSIISQCISVLKHMHLGANVAHRDMKPANMILSETDVGVVIKISDFGLAKVVKATKMSRGCCGTLPFMAPELVLEAWHDVYAADVWSMGIVFLEVLCFVHFVPQVVFNLRGRKCTSEHRKPLMETLYSCFNTPGRLSQFLGEYLRPELRDLRVSSTGLLEGGMLNVVLEERYTAQDIVDVVGERLDR